MKIMTNPRPTRSPEFLAITPRGKTPLFIDSDEQRTTVNESLAILHYLETFYPSPNYKPLLPSLEQRTHRARALSLMQETEDLIHAYEALEEAFFSSRTNKTPLEFINTIRPPLLKEIYAELKFWEGYASRSLRFIAGGNEFTLADCAFYPILGYMFRRGFVFDDKWPALKRYYETVWNMEGGSAKRAQPEGWEGRGKIDVFKGT
jgi:glutathione S-transferase